PQILIFNITGHAAIHEVIADMPCPETKEIAFAGNYRTNPDLSKSEFRTVCFNALGILQLHVEAIDSSLFRIRVEQGHQAVMSGNLLSIDHGRPDEFF